MFNLTNKRAIVTGASGGIGGAIARALHGQGAVVTLSGTREDALAALAQELKERVHAVASDLSVADGADVLVRGAEAAMGGIDILVNNAGLTRDTLAMRMKDEDWARVIDVNLGAAFRLSRACLRGMMRQRWGRIVNISSVVGVKGNPGQVNYAASKAGLIGMSKTLAVEVASRNITVNCVAPGLITTAMTQGLSDEVKNRMLTTIPLERFGTSDEVAAAVVYLASDEAAYVTGQTLHVNGGMAMI